MAISEEEKSNSEPCLLGFHIIACHVNLWLLSQRLEHTNHHILLLLSQTSTLLLLITKTHNSHQHWELKKWRRVVACRCLLPILLPPFASTKFYIGAASFLHWCLFLFCKAPFVAQIPVGRSHTPCGGILRIPKTILRCSYHFSISLIALECHSCRFFSLCICCLM